MKRFLLVSLILVFFGVLFSAIGTGSLSTEAKQGWAFYFNVANNWAAIEPPLIAYLEAQGLEYNLQRLEANATRKAKVDQIRAALRGLSDAQITAILAVIE